MALAALTVYRRAIAEAGIEIRPGFGGDGDPFDPGHLIEAHSVEESIAINDGGGADHHHLGLRHGERRPRPASPGAVLAGSAQHGAAGRLPGRRTRGRSLADGARELKMLGRYVGVRAEVVSVPAFSVHADRREIVAWLRRAPRAPETTFVIHGEPQAATALHDAIEHELGWTAAVPRYLENVRVD